MIEIEFMKYPLRINGTVDIYRWQMFAKGDHWVFYVEDIWFGQCCGEQLWALTAKMRGAEQMPRQIAIRIADACAKKFEKLLQTMEVPA